MADTSVFAEREHVAPLDTRIKGSSLGLVDEDLNGFALARLPQRSEIQKKFDSISTDVIDRDRLFDEFQPLIQRLIRQYGQTREFRQDLAGEIFYRFHSLLESYDPSRGIPVRPYLVRQLCASIYTYARQGWRRRRREISLDMSSGFCDASNQSDPSLEWDRRMDMEHVLQGLPLAISKLSKRQRQVVIWRYYDQRSFEEIALILNVQVSTARSLLRHGLNNLRRRIAGAQPRQE